MNKNNNRKATFILDLAPGDVFYFEGYPFSMNTCTGRTSEPGRTVVRYLIDGVEGEYAFHGVAYTTVYTD